MPNIRLIGAAVKSVKGLKDTGRHTHTHTHTHTDIMAPNGFEL